MTQPSKYTKYDWMLWFPYIYYQFIILYSINNRLGRPSIIVGRSGIHLSKGKSKSLIWSKIGGQDGFGVHVVSFLYVTSLLRDLGWLSLADQRCHQRLCLFYKILNNIIDVNIDELDIQLLKDSDSRKTRGYHPNKIVRQRASDKNSPYWAPLWTSTVFRTITQWNNLSPASLEAGSILNYYL